MIKVIGKNKIVAALSLREILDCIQGVKVIYWSILNLEGVWDQEKFGSILQFESEVKKSEQGFQLSWDNLFELSSRFRSLNEILIIGDNNQTKLIRYQTDSEMYVNCSVVLELVDSSYWLVKADIPFLENRISQILDTEEVL